MPGEREGDNRQLSRGPLRPSHLDLEVQVTRTSPTLPVSAIRPCMGMFGLSILGEGGEGGVGCEKEEEHKGAKESTPGRRRTLTTGDVATRVGEEVPPVKKWKTTSSRMFST